MFPNLLAALLDSHVDREERVRVANSFCSLEPCCLDSFSKRLRQYMEVNGFSASDLVDPHGPLRQVVTVQHREIPFLSSFQTVS